EPLEVTHPEMKRYFMSISEACLLVLQAGAMGQGGEVFVLDMGEPIKILDLAKEMIRLSGLEPDKDIPIVFTNPRPGEKLFEEMLSKEEGVIATKNEKIFISRLSAVDKKKLSQDLDRLKEVVRRGDKEATVEIFKKIVPNYKETKNNN
ncbi:MAG: polysaccharide biosynthesis protein, partial [Candidatus Paceibacterota bacterium]